MQNYKLFDIIVANKERGFEVHNCLCLVTTALDVLMQHTAEFLHPVELEYLATLQYPRRQVTYLRGRYAAKLALAHLRPDIPSIAIGIRNGVFGFPYLICERGIDAQISISHSDSHGVAVGFAQACPMAVDIEQVSVQRAETIQGEMLPAELELIRKNISDHNLGLTVAWTAKESLSKAIRCGLYIDFKYLEISEIVPVTDGYLLKYKNFPQYQARTCIFNLDVCTFVFPVKSELQLMPI